MQETDIIEIIRAQRAFFASGKTLDVSYRIKTLKKLKEAIIANQEKIGNALKKDLGKSALEGFMCESGLVVSEISYMLKHIKKFAKEKTVPTPLA